MKLVTSEISSRTYVKLREAMKGFGRKELWSILDHYLFHVINEEDVAELLKHLEEQKAAGVPVTAAVSEEALEKLFTERAPETKYRPSFSEGITAEVLDVNKDRLDLMFDETYFSTYLTTNEARASASKKLVEYCDSNNIPKQDHWIDWLD